MVLDMETVIQYVELHWAVIALALGYIFLAFVSAMPEPGDPRPFWTKLYDTFYKVAHILANRIIEKRQQQGQAVPPPEPKGAQ